MAYDELLANRIRSALSGDAALTESKMFGGLAFLYRRLMFTGVSACKLMAHVGKENYQDFLGHEHVREMDFTGKPMQGYVYVEPLGISTDKQLRFWLQRCKEFVSTVLPKPRR